MYRIPLENEQITKALTTPFAPVDFTDEEKEQIRENIGAGSGGGGGRNLLDNPFFRVNQRNASGAIANREYVADRWLAYESGVIRDGNIVRINAASAYSYIRQNIEPDLKTDLVGNTVTLSFMLEDGQVYSHTFSSIRDNAQNTYSMAILGAGYIDIDTRTPSNIKVLANGVNISILAVKIEIGDKSTLENDLPPDYTTELLKCMRYFERIYGNAGDALGCGQTRGNSLKITVPIRPKRTDALTVAFNGGTFLVALSDAYVQPTITSMSGAYHHANNSYMTLVMSTSAAFTAYRVCSVEFNGNNQYIDISADL